MKAIQINSYGGPEVSELNDVVKPFPKNGQILVEVYAASINPFDIKIRSGLYKEHMPIQFPATLGGDFAGVVTELGEGVDGFKVGDKVYGSANILNGGSGSYAEFATVNIANSAHMSKNVDFMEAAALPVVGCSAVQAFEQYFKLKKGQKILIHGGAGGIGHLAIQLAKSIGAYIATTVINDDLAFVKNLRADEVVDYQKQNFHEVLKDYDCVFDLVGGEVTNKSFGVLKKGGILVSMLGTPSEELAKKYGVTVVGQGTKTETANLTRVAELVDSGKMKVNIDKVFALDKVIEAFRYQEVKSPRGKVVLKIKD